MADVKGVDWRSVFSTNIIRVGYDFDTNELLVEWKRTSKISAYGPDFPFTEFEKVSKAPSVGSMVKNNVVPKYKHHYLDA